MKKRIFILHLAHLRAELGLGHRNNRDQSQVHRILSATSPNCQLDLWQKICRDHLIGRDFGSCQVRLNFGGRGISVFINAYCIQKTNQVIGRKRYCIHRQGGRINRTKVITKLTVIKIIKRVAAMNDETWQDCTRR